MTYRQRCQSRRGRTQMFARSDKKVVLFGDVVVDIPRASRAERDHHIREFSDEDKVVRREQDHHDRWSIPYYSASWLTRRQRRTWTPSGTKAQQNRDRDEDIRGVQKAVRGAITWLEAKRLAYMPISEVVKEYEIRIVDRDGNDV